MVLAPNHYTDRDRARAHHDRGCLELSGGESEVRTNWKRCGSSVMAMGLFAPVGERQPSGDTVETQPKADLLSERWATDIRVQLMFRRPEPRLRPALPVAQLDRAAAF